MWVEQTSDRVVVLELGDRVVVRDLVKAQELNGKVGRVVGFAGDRVNVSFLDRTRRVAVKLSNLDRVGDASTEMIEAAKKIITLRGGSDAFRSTLQKLEADSVVASSKDVLNTIAVLAPVIKDSDDMAKVVALATECGVFVETTAFVSVPDCFADAVLSRVHRELDDALRTKDPTKRHVVQCLFASLQCVLAGSKHARVNPRNSELRQKFHHLADVGGGNFQEQAKDLQSFQEQAKFLKELCAILDDEPIVVLEPHNGRGFTARITAIPDNFTLHTLLMDVVPRAFGEATNLTATSLGVVLGYDPIKDTQDVITGQWTLYTALAVDPDGVLPNATNDDDLMKQLAFKANKLNFPLYIWNEGIPADIPSVDGFRVVLLGHKPKLKPMWHAKRIFQAIRSSIFDVQVLSPEVYTTWMAKLTPETGTPWKEQPDMKK